MSARVGTVASERLLPMLVGPRALALAGGVVLTGSYLSVLHHVIDVVGGAGGPGVFFLAVLLSLALSAVCARTFGFRWAVSFGVVLLGVGLSAYLSAVPGGAVDAAQPVADTVSLLSGMSVFRVTRAGVWAIAMTPGPVFLSWYCFGRRAYAPGVLVGGSALVVFALTGDVGTVTALAGVVGGVAAVGFGQLDREGHEPTLRTTVLLVMVAMLVVATSASLVPGGDARPLLDRGGPSTIDASLSDTDASVDVLGSLSLSSEVRFTVTASEPRYWRVGAYDRYTGGGWVRTGPTRPYDGELDRPESRETQRLEQSFEVEAPGSTMPAAWKPVEVDSAPGPVVVTDLDGLEPRGGLAVGERYTVVSQVPEQSPDRYRRTDAAYPPGIEDRYLGLPESTPDRLERFTSNITGDADTPYGTAAAIEAWLEAEKAYSLEVDRPSGDVASAFVFEMDAGYCTYFATAMVAMLRTQGIPARFVVGYLPGEQVDDRSWVVRGLDSHAWVEVYVPDEGWVQFDPTPSDPREAAERDRLDQARAGGEPNVDTNQSRPTASAPMPDSDSTTRTTADGLTPTPTPPRTSNEAGSERTPDTAPPAQGGDGSGGGGVPGLESVLYGLVLLAGAASVIYRSGIGRRLYRWIWLRRPPAGPPAARIEAAADRAEYLLARRHRSRRVGETRRAYLDALGSPAGSAVDERAATLFHLGERSRFAGRATEPDAAAAERLLRELRADPADGG